MADELALSLDATPPGTYRQRGTNSLQRLFRVHFPELVARYETEFAKRLGKYRLERESPLRRARCRSPMKIIAIITEPTQVPKILRHLIKTGKPPPGLDPASLN